MNTLATKSKPIIGLIIPIINHSFFSNIADHLTTLAYNSGYLVSVFQSNEDYQQEVEIVNSIIAQQFAGVIVSISKNTIDSTHFKCLQEAGIPLVFIDRVCEDIIAPKVLINNYEITYTITENLIKKGNKRIALIIGTNDINVFRERQQGYLDAIKKHGLSYQMPVVETEFSIEKGKDIFIKLWSSDNRPDAIISSSIQLTLGILLQTKLYDVKIPHKLELIILNRSTSALSLKEIGEINCYARLTGAYMAFLTSLNAVSNEVSILLLDDTIKNRVLDYGKDKKIIVFGWDEKNNQINKDSVIPFEQKDFLSS